LRKSESDAQSRARSEALAGNKDVSVSSDTSPRIPELVTPAIAVRKEFRFADRKMFEINRYVNGAKHGVQLLYDLNTSVRPKYLEYYQDGRFIWGTYPSADVDYTLEHGTFLKGLALGVDSVFVRAPFDSTTIWYEGTFVRINGMPTPMGIHRVYDEKGMVRMEVEYDSSRVHEGIGRKRPSVIRRNQSN
jgi:hypothetical protein